MWERRPSPGERRRVHGRVFPSGAESSWGPLSEFTLTAGRRCLIRLLHHSSLVLWPPDAEQPPGHPWPLASQGVLNLPSAKGSTAVASEGGVLGPQLGSRVAAEPAATAPPQGDGAWHWCGCTAAEGEGSGRCYLWGHAKKCWKNGCHPCQTFFIWCRHRARLVLVGNFSVGKNKRGWGGVAFVLLFWPFARVYGSDQRQLGNLERPI